MLGKCCFCVPLRTGCIILGILHVLFGLAATIAIIVTGLGPTDLKISCVLTVIILILGIIFIVIAFQNLKKFVKYWTYLYLFCAGVGLVFYGRKYEFFSLLLRGEAAVIILFIVMIVIYLYTLLIAYSYKKEEEEEDQ
ncbi:uncharacterized protein LOC115623160 [Scaptodrosophila lebanonensis]|uniref:Uncharacterized protein LOC115623160 n=1 Tax=Drosophila lebanonensis TaxID=7225 RepID=A0A6J2TDN7_DROLE|nr:uncharacterized protein LOC115623160 [Scaptodrosophila lebanonensis]